jgi:aromatic ring-opening dioxygenase LigB subunit
VNLNVAAILPHGSGLLGNEASYQEARATARAVCQLIAEAQPQRLILITPHLLRPEGFSALITAERAGGSLEGRSLELELDPSLARSWINAAQAQGLSVFGVGFGTDRGPLARAPLDWGSLVPLLLLQDVLAPLPPLVLLAPRRDHRWQELYALGSLLEQVLEVPSALIASADQAHAHSPQGPYGFHPAAQAYDEVVYRLTLQGALPKLLELDPKLVELARPDSLWQMLVAAGAIGYRKPDLIGYHRPSYFGMLSTGYRLTLTR